MLPQEIIRRKRDGAALADAEIALFVEGLTAGRITEGQVAAFAMAVFFNGMSRAETVALTRAMTGSGTRLRWDDLDGPVVDKHSTGGIGDKVSLILAPIMAACGAYVPMISGRGLGHTGGTLDKLDSIPGYDTAPDVDRLRRAVREAGCAIIGQTAELAPADRRLYAIRDVTATVESMPLIVASILSKKLAAGLDALVMDVKVGSGAFLPSLAAARELATGLVEVANGAGLRCSALLTDMNQNLGRTAGNALEVEEAIDVLTGGSREPRLRAVTLALAAELLTLSGSGDGADERVARVLDSGAAAERFARMVRALGGPGDLLEQPGRHLPSAPVQRPVHLPAGVVGAIDARALGLAVIALGGGRQRPTDPIDHAVGLAEVKGIGEALGPNQPFAIVHARSEASVEAVSAGIATAVTVAEAPAARMSEVIVARIGGTTDL
ncbi:MAG TPA: thymidine phosphorylase [Geminicoccaceae bacterium]|nr:thymidine phosphorylase [Geminicoccaceae bacterium]